jgi:hypothetical protein
MSGGRAVIYQTELTGPPLAVIFMDMEATPTAAPPATFEEGKAADDAMQAMIDATRVGAFEGEVLAAIYNESVYDACIPWAGNPDWSWESNSVAVLAYMVDYIEQEGWYTDADGFITAR